MGKNIFSIATLLLVGLSLTTCNKKPTAPDNSNPLDPKHGPPKILSVEPKPASVDLRADTVIVVKFDDQMDQNSLKATGSFRVGHTLGGQLTPIPGVLAFSQTAPNNIATVVKFSLEPNNYFLYNDEIAVDLNAANIKDTEGLSLTAENNAWSFKTYPVTDVSRLRIFFIGDRKGYPDKDTLFTSAGINTSFKVFAYKSVSDSLDITGTVMLQPESGSNNLIVNNGNPAGLTTQENAFKTSSFIATIGIKNQSGAATQLPLKLFVDTNGPVAPVAKSPDNGSSINNQTPTFKWGRVKTAVSYNLEVYDTANPSSPVISVPVLPDTSYNTAPIRLVDATYSWRIRAKNNRGNFGPWSSPSRLVTIDISAPLPPELNLPKNETATNILKPTFSWLEVSDAAFYQIQIDNSRDLGSPVDTSGFSTATSYTTSINLRPDGTYYWHVRSKDAAGNVSLWSETRSFDIDTEKPLPPTVQSPADTNRTTIDSTPRFVWSNVAGAKFYRFQLSVSRSNFANPIIKKDSLSAPTYEVTIALDDGTYYWRVFARDAAGNESDPSKVWVIKVDANKPAKPVLLSPPIDSTIYNVTPEFKWRLVSDAVYYDFALAEDVNFTNPRTARIFQNQSLPPSYKIPPLSDKKYFWRIQAFDGVNSSDFSDIGVVTIGAQLSPTLLAPNDMVTIMVTIPGDRQPLFDWLDVPGANSYVLQVTDSVDNGVPVFRSPKINVTISSPLASSYKHAMLLPDSTYFWRVQAKDKLDSVSQFSAVRFFVIYDDPPNQPFVFLPVNGSMTNRTPKFDWRNVTGAVSYELQVADNSNFSGTLVIIQPALTNSEYTVQNTVENPSPLMNGKTYHWRVRAKDANNMIGEWSSPVFNFTVN